MYHYGSSASSQSKDAVIEKQTDTAAKVASVAVAAQTGTGNGRPLTTQQMDVTATGDVTVREKDAG